jgi:hypothetical protein
LESLAGPQGAWAALGGGGVVSEVVLGLLSGDIRPDQIDE